MSICSQCAENVHLKRRIEEEGVPEYCSACRRQQPKVFDIARLAALMGPVIEKHFSSCAERCVQLDEYGYATEPPIGFDLREVAMGIMKQDVDFLDELVEAIVENEERGLADGARFFDLGEFYAPIVEAEPLDNYTPQWKSIIDELKHHRRFFSEAVREFFDGIFNNVDNITTFRISPLKIQPVVRAEEPGFSLYRSRIIDRSQIETIQNDPFKHVGPAPREKARAGRMSPDGVVALYCATEKDTALAELRPTIGHISAVIELCSTKTLRLIDLTRLERAIDDGWDALLDPHFRKNLEARKFLRQLHNLISQPVVPGNEADYLITQTMAEYLAHVHEPGFDGIVFGSTQRAKGTNVVLFANRRMNSDKSFPVRYVPGSLTIYRTSQLQYVHSEMIRELQPSLWEDADPLS